MAALDAWPALALLISVKLLSGILGGRNIEGGPVAPESVPAGAGPGDVITRRAAPWQS